MLKVYEYLADEMYSSLSVLIAADNRADADRIVERYRSKSCSDWIFYKCLRNLKASGKKARVLFTMGHAE